MVIVERIYHLWNSISSDLKGDFSYCTSLPIKSRQYIYKIIAHVTLINDRLHKSHLSHLSLQSEKYAEINFTSSEW